MSRTTSLLSSYKKKKVHYMKISITYIYTQPQHRALLYSTWKYTLKRQKYCMSMQVKGRQGRRTSHWSSLESLHPGWRQEVGKRMEDVQDCSAPFLEARVLEEALLVPCCYASLHSRTHVAGNWATSAKSKPWHDPTKERGGKSLSFPISAFGEVNSGS